MKAKMILGALIAATLFQFAPHEAAANVSGKSEMQTQMNDRRGPPPPRRGPGRPYPPQRPPGYSQCNGYFAGYYSNGVYTTFDMRENRGQLNVYITLNGNPNPLVGYGTCYDYGNYANFDFTVQGVRHVGQISYGRATGQQVGGANFDLSRR